MQARSSERARVTAASFLSAAVPEHPRWRRGAPGDRPLAAWRSRLGLDEPARLPSAVAVRDCSRGRRPVLHKAKDRKNTANSATIRAASSSSARFVLVQSVEEQGFQGLVARRRNSVYESGLGTGAWMEDARARSGRWDPHELAVHRNAPDTLRVSRGRRILRERRRRRDVAPAEQPVSRSATCAAWRSLRENRAASWYQRRPDRTAYVAGRSDGRLYRRVTPERGEARPRRLARATRHNRTVALRRPEPWRDVGRR